MASLSLWCYEQDHDETGGHSLESSFAADARAQGFVSRAHSNRDRETGETQAISTFLSTRKDFQLQGEGKLSLIPPFALLICYLVLQNCVEKVNS